MIGATVTRKDDGAVFTVTGYAAGAFILTPEEFGSPQPVTYVALVADFDVAPEDATPPPSEREVLAERDAEANRTINQRYGQAVAGAEAEQREFRPAEGSPEAFFRDIAEDEQ